MQKECTLHITPKLTPNQTYECSSFQAVQLYDPIYFSITLLRVNLVNNSASIRGSMSIQCLQIILCWCLEEWVFLSLYFLEHKVSWSRKLGPTLLYMYLIQCEWLSCSMPLTVRRLLTSQSPPAHEEAGSKEAWLISAGHYQGFRDVPWNFALSQDWLVRRNGLWGAQSGEGKWCCSRCDRNRSKNVPLCS